MAKVHKSLRIDEGLASRVSALAEDGESEAAAYSRVIEAGVDALSGEADARASSLAGALSDHIDSLKAQLAAKDEQIKALSALADQSQRLQAMAETKALEAGESAEQAATQERERIRGLGAWDRLMRRF